MGTKRDKNCRDCYGEGWVYDYLGGCGDPECCGGPFKIQCRTCNNDWSPDDPEDDDLQSNAAFSDRCTNQGSENMKTSPSGSLERIVGRRVVCAANRRADGAIVCGARHFDTVMRAQMDGSDWIDSAQGFIDQRGVWMDRLEAWKVAEAAGQILRRCGGDTRLGGTLYSENLY